MKLLDSAFEYFRARAKGAHLEGRLRLELGVVESHLLQDLHYLFRVGDATAAPADGRLVGLLPVEHAWGLLRLTKLTKVPLSTWSKPGPEKEMNDMESFSRFSMPGKVNIWMNNRIVRCGGRREGEGLRMTP